MGEVSDARVWHANGTTSGTLVDWAWRGCVNAHDRPNWTGAIDANTIPGHDNEKKIIGV